MTGLESKMNVLESNQLTFLNELRELRLEIQARDRLFSSDLVKTQKSIRFVNRRVADLELALVASGTYDF